MNFVSPERSDLSADLTGNPFDPFNPLVHTVIIILSIQQLIAQTTHAAQEAARVPNSLSARDLRREQDARRAVLLPALRRAARASSAQYQQQHVNLRFYQFPAQTVEGT